MCNILQNISSNPPSFPSHPRPPPGTGAPVDAHDAYEELTDDGGMYSNPAPNTAAAITAAADGVGDGNGGP